MRVSRRHLLIASLSMGAVAACGRKVSLPSLPAGSVVLALGDSLTYGTGAPGHRSYPAALANLTGWNVLNAGVPGETSAGALARLKALLQEHSPKLVLVSIGGNDFLRRMPPADTRANIRSICQQAVVSGAQVVLIAVPEVSAVAAVVRSLSDHAMYKELADELKLPLHAAGWSKVLSDPALKSDAIHANGHGYEAFAGGLAQSLRNWGLVAVK